MSKIKKYVQKQSLDKYRVWITDTDPLSKYFQLSQFPDVLTAGKNSFLINGSPELEPTTEVLVEILDSNGQPIYRQPIAKYLEGLARVITVEVYDDTAPGQATVTILGRLRQNEMGHAPPTQFQNAYNVKWTKNVLVAPNRPNATPIRLYKYPRLVTSELLVPYRNNIPGASILHNSGSVIGVTTIPNIGTPLTTLIPSGFVYDRQMIGATVGMTVNGAAYTGTIASITNNRLARLEPAVTASASSVYNFAASNFSFAYSASDQLVPTLQTRSFVDMRIKNLTTFTGDIQRAKFYVRSLDQPGDYQFLTDVTVESTSLTTTASIHTGDHQISMGHFISQSVANDYWQAGTITNRKYDAPAGVTLTVESTNLLDSMYISVPNSGYSSSTTVPRFYHGLVPAITFEKDAEYTLKGNYLCLKSTSSFDAKMEVYLFGSGFPSSSLSPYGTLIHTLEVPGGQTKQYFLDDEVNFVAPNSGSAYLRYVMYGGQWHVSEAEVAYANAFGFNPDEIRVLHPLMGRRFERLQFKVELFDVNSTRVPIDIESDIVYFDGGNLMIKGTDNRIDGILTVAPSGSGPLLSSKGFIDRNGNFTAGQIIAIGDLTPQVFHKNTAFFAGTSSFGPEISVGDKMYGYYDLPSDQFILIIKGTLLVGSGSNYTDLRALVPGDTTDKYFDRARGGHADFEENRGRRALSAGEYNDQIGRMGLYTRGPTGYITASAVSPALVVNSINPYLQTGSLIMLATSCSIDVPTGSNFYNETIYADIDLSVVQLPPLNTGSYYLEYTLEVLSSWTGYPSVLTSGQRLVKASNIVVTNSGSYSPPAITQYPIPVPSPRTGNTLYLVTKVTVDAVATN